MGKQELMTFGHVMDVLYDHHNDEDAPLDTEIIFQCGGQALRFITSEYDEEEEIVTVFLQK